jgi:hypothetical protein
MKIIVPQRVKASISKVGNKTIQRNAYKIYGALYKAHNRRNRIGYFDMPSSYLESINSRYNRIINQFIEDGIIEYFKRPTLGDNIFQTVYKKYYNKSLNICMKYRFIIDINIGDEIELDMENPNNKRWWSLTKETLIKLGYDDIKIKRDDFGRRVWHSGIMDYKTYLHKKGLMVIDAKCSQPRLLYILMKERNIIDEEYNNIFHNGFDFYNQIVKKLNLKDRQEAKDLFMFWINSSGYVPKFHIHKLFPEVSSFIKGLKTKNYKDACSFLQREEAKIWVDDLLENLPVDFGFTIHDSLIVRDRDCDDVLLYCKKKYPQIEFDTKEL